MRSWTTRLVKGEPRDLQLDETGQPTGLARWTAPLRPLVPGSCANCCGHRDREGTCTDCGMTRAEDSRLHRAMARKLGVPPLLAAVEAASDSGRQVMALKLATAAFLHAGDGDEARLLRIRQLSRVRRPDLAVAEAGDWVLQSGAPAARIARVLSDEGLSDEALDLLDAALSARHSHEVLLERARVYLELDEADIAVEDAAQVVREGARALLPRALEILEAVVDELLLFDKNDEALAAIDAARPRSHRHPPLAYRVGLAYENKAELALARRWFQQTLRLEKGHADAASRLEALEKRLHIASTLESLG